VAPKAGWGIATGLGLIVVAAVASTPRDAAQDEFNKNLQPFLAKYCFSCHGDKQTSSADVYLGTKVAKDLTHDADLWNRVVKALEGRHMPPPSKPQPTESERQLAVRSIQAIIAGDCGKGNPGRVTLRRLNRAEYNNTVRDLFGFDIHPADDFPADTIGNGFDNIGDVLSMSTLHMEQYLAAAEKLATQAIWLPDSKKSTYAADQMTLPATGASQSDGYVNMFTNSEAMISHKFPRSGDYRIQIAASAQQAGPDPAKMRVVVGNQVLGTCDVKAVVGKPVVYEFPVTLAGGDLTIHAQFVNDFYDQNLPVNQRDRNLWVHSITVVGPTNPPNKLPESHRNIISVRPEQVGRDQALRTIFKNFATKAWRHPVGGDELQGILKICDLAAADKEPFERQVQLGVEACLVSPRFLFRFELDPLDKGVRDLDDFELASRLSYFLWSSMPDDELLRLAQDNKLHEPAVLKEQVTRMLANRKTRTLGENFAAQWLEVRKLENARPSLEDFPLYTPELKKAMAEEPVKYFNYITMEQRSVLDLLDSNFTYLNDDLAKLYGLPSPNSKDTILTDLKGRRGGILNMASILTVTSNPTRTSPVKRGRFILDNILGMPPPMPPPGVPGLEKAGEKISGATVRLRLAQHRKDPACSTCHDRMDGLGLALENYNPIGQWRDQDGGVKIDASGELPGGIKVTGPQDLKKVLLDQKDKFVRCLAEKMLTFALGRGVEMTDACHVDEIVQKTKQSNYNMGALIQAIVESDPFRKKKIS